MKDGSISERLNNSTVYDTLYSLAKERDLKLKEK